MTWQDRIREARLARAGLSQAKLAKLAGVSQALIAKIETNDLHSSEHLLPILKELGLDPSTFPEEAFKKGRPKPRQSQAQTQSLEMPLPDYARDPAYWAAAAGLVGDVPLYASAEGGQGSLIIERDSIGTVKRPPLLQGVRDGYALYLIGSSMIPEFEPGDVLMINPRLPVLEGTSCVFYNAQGDDPRAMVKRLLGSSDDIWRVRQFNPADDFELDRAEWPTRHRVVSKNFR